MDQQYYIKLEEELGAHNYNPLDVVLHRGEGVFGSGTWKATSIWTAWQPIRQSIRGTEGVMQLNYP